MELQLLVHTIATATWDLSRVCNLNHRPGMEPTSLGILVGFNPLSHDGNAAQLFPISDLSLPQPKPAPASLSQGHPPPIWPQGAGDQPRDLLWADPGGAAPRHEPWFPATSGALGGSPDPSTLAQRFTPRSGKMCVSAWVEGSAQEANKFQGCPPTPEVAPAAQSPLGCSLRTTAAPGP